MKIALACPSYQKRMHTGSAYCWAQDAMTALEFGWRPVLLWVDANSIEVSRNLLVKQAEEAGARLLLMMDSDSFSTLPQGGLAHMWKVMSETGAAVVGAAVPIRGGVGMNCEPSQPGDVYEGVVGSAYLLIDMVKLRNLPRPWFRLEMAEDGLSKLVGSDINFCRSVHAHGQKVVVNFALPMAHAESSAVATRFD
jgi:hypothetical protein